MAWSAPECRNHQRAIALVQLRRSGSRSSRGASPARPGGEEVSLARPAHRSARPAGAHRWRLPLDRQQSRSARNASAAPEGARDQQVGCARAAVRFGKPSPLASATGARTTTARTRDERARSAPSLLRSAVLSGPRAFRMSPGDIGDMATRRTLNPAPLDRARRHSAATRSQERACLRAECRLR